jgi:hypothetical protein
LCHWRVVSWREEVSLRLALSKCGDLRSRAMTPRTIEGSVFLQLFVENRWLDLSNRNEL